MTKKAKITLGSAIGSSIIMNGLVLFAQWYAVQPFGSDDFIPVSFFFVFPLLLAVLCIILPLPGLIFEKTRDVSKLLILSGFIYVVSGIALVRVGYTIREQAFFDLAKRAQPLVSAIKQYENGHTKPPPDLEALVPEYMSSIPDTGMGAYPAFGYSAVDEENKKYWYGNSWVLYVDAPLGFLNRDQFLYFPKENYPETVVNGVLERFGGWAYLHD